MRRVSSERGTRGGEETDLILALEGGNEGQCGTRLISDSLNQASRGPPIARSAEIWKNFPSLVCLRMSGRWTPETGTVDRRIGEGKAEMSWRAANVTS